jgi:hypothetical protein
MRSGYTLFGGFTPMPKEGKVVKIKSKLNESNGICKGYVRKKTGRI